MRALLRALFADQRRRARQQFGLRGGLCGSVTLIQRFGSALNLTPHLHSLVLDGVYPGPAYRLRRPRPRTWPALRRGPPAA